MVIALKKMNNYRQLIELDFIKYQNRPAKINVENVKYKVYFK